VLPTKKKRNHRVSRTPQSDRQANDPKNAKDVSQKKRVAVDKKQVGLRIQQARLERGLSQHDLSVLLRERYGIKLTAAAVGQWERGANLPQMATFEKTADLLGRRLDWFVSGLEEREVAETFGESQLLKMAKGLPEGALAGVIAIMENWPATNPLDPIQTVHIMERLSSLSDQDRLAALAFLDGLPKNSSPIKMMEDVRLLRSLGKAERHAVSAMIQGLSEGAPEIDPRQALSESFATLAMLSPKAKAAAIAVISSLGEADQKAKIKATPKPTPKRRQKKEDRRSGPPPKQALAH
jgi:transcriptional regulator with XRE-family HTH domain